MKRKPQAGTKATAKSTKPTTKSASPKRPVSDLPSLQLQLDEIDRQLLNGLVERIQVVAQLSQLSKQQGQRIPLWEMHQHVTELAKHLATEHQLNPQPLVDWLKHASSVCQQETRVAESIAYLGPQYSYSYLAAVRHFGLGATLVPVASIAAVFDELVRGQAAFGVVPIENSTDGRVVDTLGMFARWPVRVCGEVLLPVHHCLLGRCARNEISEVYSKPQALSQCRGWLSQHVPDARLVEVASTAAAARLAADKHGAAAIASREAGVHHGLEIIDENIEDNSENITRFAIIGHRRCEPSGRDKTSIMFQLKHQPGSLADAMTTFQKSKVNLTWIESFPLPLHPNEYLFFVELEGHEDSKAVHGALERLKQQALRLEILGSYPRGTA